MSHRPTPHVDARYEADLQQLSRHLTAEGRLARELLGDAVVAARTLDSRLARQVETRERGLVERRERADQLCVHVLARWAPVGGDLRLATTTLKADMEIERIGDEAVNLARRTLELCGRSDGAVKRPVELDVLADLVLDALDVTLLALQNRDAELARTVPSGDARIDAANRRVFALMIDAMRAHPDEADRALCITSMSRHLERAGDHAVSIARLVAALVVT